MLYFLPVKNRASQVHTNLPTRLYDMTHYIGMISPAADDNRKFYFSSANCMHCFTPKELIEISARINFLEEFYNEK